MSEESKKTKVKLTICGTQFIISADESSQYIQKIAKMVDERIKSIDNSDSKLSLQMATIVAALNYCDQLEKERIITRELIKKTGESESVAKDATEQLNKLILENAQLKEEKAGLHRVISELRAGIYTDEQVQTEYEQSEKEEYMPQVEQQVIEQPIVQQIPQVQMPVVQQVPQVQMPVVQQVPQVQMPVVQQVPQVQMPVVQQIPQVQMPVVQQMSVKPMGINNITESKKAVSKKQATTKKSNNTKPVRAFRPVSPSRSGMASNSDMLANIVTDEEIF